MLMDWPLFNNISEAYYFQEGGVTIIFWWCDNFLLRLTEVEVVCVFLVKRW